MVYGTILYNVPVLMCAHTHEEKRSHLSHPPHLIFKLSSIFAK